MDMQKRVGSDEMDSKHTTSCPSSSRPLQKERVIEELEQVLEFLASLRNSSSLKFSSGFLYFFDSDISNSLTVQTD